MVVAQGTRVVAVGVIAGIAAAFVATRALGSLLFGVAAIDVATKVNEQVEASSEVAQVVEALERQYDAFIAAQENQSLLARDEDLPSGCLLERSKDGGDGSWGAARGDGRAGDRPCTV